eukprot:767492-Hanusia_phi.AAC.4
MSLFWLCDQLSTQDGQKAGKERILRRIVHEDAIFYKNLSAEQGARIFFQAFEGSDFLEKVKDIKFDKRVDKQRTDRCCRHPVQEHRRAASVPAVSSGAELCRTGWLYPLQQDELPADFLSSSCLGGEYTDEEAEEESSGQNGLRRQLD